MAAVVIPGQARRWGSESTNFYKNSTSETPGLPSRQKLYRCVGNQYTNSGHYHVGTKAMPRNPPLDRYGAPSTYKLRTVDQRLPKALSTPYVQMQRMAPDRPVNLYQSHKQSHSPYAMSRPPLKASHSADDGLARSLSSAFYITSYQSDIAKYAGHRQRTSSMGTTDTATLTGQLESRRNSISGPLSDQRVKAPRVSSAPPVRLALARPLPSGPNSEQPRLQRRRSFSAVQRSYPSKGEMLKEIFTVFPSPQPQPVSRRASRPSSAVTLRSGKIPSLRQPAEV